MRIIYEKIYISTLGYLLKLISKLTLHVVYILSILNKLYETLGLDNEW